jgi:hypothetical protein
MTHKWWVLPTLPEEGASITLTTFHENIKSGTIFSKIHGNEVPNTLYYREYFHIPSLDEGKLRRLYFEMVFRRNILPKYFAS